MSVTAAAKALGVGRPALSNLLNGNAALSAEMAAKLEQAFGADAKKLLDLQRAYDAGEATAGPAAATPSYVPPYLELKARDISAWASRPNARARLPVFLRILVNSTGRGLTRVDFPGNDDAERPGWDGRVEASAPTPWIAEGESGWEFGCAENSAPKANADYDKRTKSIAPEIRKRTTFVFVTPHGWPAKARWEAEKRAGQDWKNVRALDASDLEQWLEQSIPAQSWLAHELERPTDGVEGLDACWSRWADVCEPPLSAALFKTAVTTELEPMKRRLSAPPGRPIVIGADSTAEALAFLHCLFEHPDLAPNRDRLAFFSKPETLKRLASPVPGFIPIMASRDVAREFARFQSKAHAIVIYPRNASPRRAANEEAHIDLHPLGHEAFYKALQAMGLSHNEIERRGRESGRSLTVLRRRLSTNDAIRNPPWAENAETAIALIPLVLAGAWNAEAPSDRAVIERLAGGKAYPEIERDIAELLLLDDPPVWSVETWRGLVSKIDALFAIRNRVIGDDLNRFFEIAREVLGEDDPALDLPEQGRWLAGVLGKKRALSSALREGIGETLVLLAVYGAELFGDRWGFDAEAKVAQLVRVLLPSPLSARTIESQADDLRLYAEAAPDVFLSIVETDLRATPSATLALMRPIEAPGFTPAYRARLLSALEVTAWSPSHFRRAVLALARLAQVKIDDNLSDKPISSLCSIFRAWVPQTAAPIEARKAALDSIEAEFPNAAWEIAIKQLNGDDRIGDPTARPRWRNDAYGFGEGVTANERDDFRRHCLGIVLGRRPQSRATLADLIRCIPALEATDQDKVWSLIESWAEDASNEDKAAIRERIRVLGVFRRAPDARWDGRAKAIYKKLCPDDPVQEHAWMFRTDWIWEGADADVKTHDARRKRLNDQRRAAVAQIYAASGAEGVMRLAKSGNTAELIGAYLREQLSEPADVAGAVRTIRSHGDLKTCRAARGLVAGLLSDTDDGRRAAVIGDLIRQSSEEDALEIFKLAPFNEQTWTLALQRGAETAKRYWAEVDPRYLRDGPSLIAACEALLAAGRPHAAFYVASLHLEAQPSALLFRLLKAIGTSDAEATGTYRLDDYFVVNALKALNERGDIPVSDLALLEFQFISLLEKEDGIPNLERELARNPGLFADLLACAYRRDDDGADPPHLHLDDPAASQRRARAAFRVFEMIKSIPGLDPASPRATADGVIAWARAARQRASELARREICDQVIGKVFAQGPKSGDGVHPSEPVRDAIEILFTPALKEGFEVAVLNSRGAHWRGPNGDQERAIAEKFGRDAHAIEHSHPQTASILKSIEAFYLHHAKRNDANWRLDERLP